MSFPMQPIIKRSFTSTGAATTFPLPNNAVKVEVYDLTNIATTAAATAGAEAALYQKAFSINGMPAGSGYSYTNTINTKTMVESLLATNGGGFTFFDSSNQTPGAPRAITAVTAANPAVVSAANTTGLITNTSVVRMINVAGMQQISSMDFTVGTVTAGVSFGLRYLNASAFAAPGTTGFYRIIPFNPIYYPRRRFITGITQATSAVITLSVVHEYTVGQLVRINVPAAFGMSEINGLTGTITAITTGATNTITVDIDSSSFTAFAFPTSATAAGGVTFPQVVPVGEAATNTVLQPFANLLDDATRNTSELGVILDTNVVGTAGDSMLLIAYAGLDF